MSPLLHQSLAPLLFALLGLPLVWQDNRDYSVSSPLLSTVYVVWEVSALFLDCGETRLGASAIVLLIGALLLALLPDRLGEADVIFMSGMAALFSFWRLMIALALGCVAGLAVFLWLSRGGRDEALLSPIPLLPSLYWGGLTVILGGIRL